MSVSPNAAPPLASVTLTLSNFTLLPQCNAQAPTPQTCIQVSFIQGTRVTPIANATGSGSTKITIRAQCTSPTSTGCVDPGIAGIRAISPNGENAETGFTVQAAGATTTTPSSTTTSSSTSTSTSLPSSTTSSSTTSTTFASTTTTTVKKDDEHSDVPRYIAVALVVLAALATAVVDSRMRRLRG